MTSSWRERLAVPRAGDVLFSKDGTVGKVHVVEEREPFAVLSSLAILRPSAAAIIPGFLGHCLRMEAVLGDAVRRKTGSAIRRIVLADLKEVRVPLPPLPEQRRIADILDRADAMRARRRDAIALLEELFTAVFVEVFGDPAANPRAWPVVTVSDVAEQVTDGEHVTPARATHGVKLLSARNVRDGYLDFENVDFIPLEEYERIRRRCDPRRGDVLISCSGTIGRVATVETEEPFSLVRSAALVRPRREVVSARYLADYLRMPALKARMLSRANASSQANLFQGQIRELPVMLPPLRLQQGYAERAAVFDKLKAAHAASLAEMDALFASLQHRAFRGEL